MGVIKNMEWVREKVSYLLSEFRLMKITLLAVNSKIDTIVPTNNGQVDSTRIDTIETTANDALQIATNNSLTIYSKTFVSRAEMEVFRAAMPANRFLDVIVLADEGDIENPGIRSKLTISKTTIDRVAYV